MRTRKTLRVRSTLLAMVGLAMLGVVPAWSAQTVHLWLTVDGTRIEGESSIQSLEREGTIECLSYSEEGYSRYFLWLRFDNTDPA